MKVLVIDGGGRGHALVWKLKKSKFVGKIYCAPGNAGTAKLAENVPLKADDIDGLLAFAKEKQIDLTVVGPEDPLCLGIVDLFQQNGLLIVGPTRKAAMLEGSKIFTKELCLNYGIPTAKAEIFDDFKAAIEHAKGASYPLVVKADGLALGKGVIICKNFEEAEKAILDMMVEKVFKSAGDRILIEECLPGEEASFLVFTDGVNVVPLATSQDHKPIYDDDRGPNTGGMGAYSPAPVVTDAVYRQVMNEIIYPILRAVKEQTDEYYRGVLYAGLMIKDGKAKLLEINVRCGDPEIQPILMRLISDIFPILYAIAKGESIKGMELEWDPRPAVGVVQASGGYPGPYKKGKVITGIDHANELPDTFVFEAGTAIKDGVVVTGGGRVDCPTSLGKDIEAAIGNAYKAVALIKWEGEQHRSDIGKKALGRGI